MSTASLADRSEDGIAAAERAAAATLSSTGAGTGRPDVVTTMGLPKWLVKTHGVQAAVLDRSLQTPREAAPRPPLLGEESHLLPLFVVGA